MSLKNCKTCGHRSGSFQLGKCMSSGFSCTTERQMPTICGFDFKGWTPRHKRGLKKWLLSLWYGN